MYNPISQFSNKLIYELLLFINNNIKQIKYEKYIFIVFVNIYSGAYYYYNIIQMMNI